MRGRVGSIKRMFGEARARHRFGCCRYRGLDRFKMQSYLTFMVLNLKYIVLPVTGTRFRPVAKELTAEKGSIAPVVGETRP